MKNQDEPQVMPNHEYDGIQEYNHPAPLWWQIIFYASIVFGIFYVLYYHILSGPSIQDEFKADWTEHQNAQLVRQAAGGGGAERTQKLLALSNDPSATARGKAVYDSKCASCHAIDGGGIVGPNLTDNYWVNGDGKTESIFKVINEGVADKGMPPWGPLLKDQELLEVTVFVGSLKGSKPLQPKAPQGNAI